MAHSHTRAARGRRGAGYAAADTRQERDLAGTLTADIVLQLLSYVAETERAFIRQRQAEGIAAARARGQTFGRPRLKIPPAFAEVHSRWSCGEMSSRAAAERLGVSQPTFPALGARNAVGHAMRRSRSKAALRPELQPKGEKAQKGVAHRRRWRRGRSAASRE